MKEKMHKIKELWIAIACFVNQTRNLAISIFRKKDNLVLEYKDLAPIDNASGCKEHIKALEWAVSSERIKNIALSGPFGSGKSSIIETFLRNNPLAKEKSIKISLATFTEITEEGPKVVSENLEEGILKQLFYKIKQSKIPQSRYRKLHKINYWPIFWKTIICSLVALAFLFIFWPSVFNSAYNLILEAGPRVYNCVLDIAGIDRAAEEYVATISDHVLSNISLIVFIGLSLLVLSGVAYIAQRISARWCIKEIKLPTDTTVGTKEVDRESIFNKNIDEIVYFFEATNYRLVFIEDLDRFGDSEIFIQLRELNTLLNNCETIKGTVVFVYAIRDDMFKDSDRTKFFDFIIPVIPVINSTNSGESMLNMLGVEGERSKKHDISRGYVLDIAPYISDMRVLQNIYNEFIVYKETLKVGQKLTLQDEKMMSLIVFKNLYPNQFAELQKENGIIKQAFQDKDAFIKEKTNDLTEQIDAKHKTLDSIEEDNLNDVRELKHAMLCAMTDGKGFAYKVRLSSGEQYLAETILADGFDMLKLLNKGNWIVDYTTLRGSDSDLRMDIPSICTPYVERYRYLQFAGETQKETLKTEIAQLEDKIKKLSRLSLQELIEKYSADNVLVSLDSEKDALLIFLLRKGYINEEYSGYINFFKANSITTADKNFILSIKNQSPYPFAYSLVKVAETLEQLQLHEFSEKAILNFDLLKHMLLDTHYDAQLQILFNQLCDDSTKCRSFIDEFIDYEDTRKYFVKRLAAVWPGLWESVYYNNALTYARKIKYIEWLLEYTDHDTLKKQNKNDLISQFFMEHNDILQKLSPHLADCIIDAIPIWEIEFVKIEIAGVPHKILDFIFEKGFYALNLGMISSIVAYKNEALLAQLTTQTYTVITSLGFEALTDKIRNNWEQYVDQIILAKENTQESVGAVLALLERCITNQPLCIKLVDHLQFCVDDINQVCASKLDTEGKNVQAIWDMLLDSGKIAVTWANVYAYWKEFSLNQVLLNYITANCQMLASDDGYGYLDDDFKRAAILSELNIKVFERLLFSLRMDRFNIALKEISADKLELMILNHNFDFTVGYYEQLSACAPQLCPQFILLNQDEFAKEIENLELTEDVFEKVVMSDDISITLKESIVNQYGSKLMTEIVATYLCKLDIDISRTVFGAIWDKIDTPLRKDFMLNNIGILEAKDFDQYFADLGDPYAKLKRTPYRHDEFIPDTPQNRELVGRLQYVHYLTSCEYETQTQYGAKRTEKKIPVIRCRVKVKPEETVPTKTK